MRQEQIPKARLARPGLQLLDDRHRRPALVAPHVRVVAPVVGLYWLVHEGVEPFPELLHLGRVIEVHAALLSILSTCFQPSSAIGFARMPASRACAEAAVPSTTRFRIPCRIAEMRNRL